MSYKIVKTFYEGKECSVKDLMDVLRCCDSMTIGAYRIGELSIHTDNRTGKKQLEIEIEEDNSDNFSCSC